MVKIYGSPSGAFSSVLAYDGPQCLNVELARQGYSYLDPVIGKTIRNQDPLLHAIEEAQKQAKRSRSGVWIYGDFLDD
jgi:endonuclease YncB( thermonuclease family)